MTRDLYLVARAAAARTYRIEQTEATRVGYVRALINTGDYNGRPGASRRCRRSVAAVRPRSDCTAAGQRGRGSPALHRTEDRPHLAMGLERLHPRPGHHGGCRRGAAQVGRTHAGRRRPGGERSWLAVAAFDARLNGKFDTALTLARSLSQAAGPGDFRAMYARGEAQVLAGDQAGWKVLAEALAADPRPAAVDVWEREELPVLQALAVGQGITLTPRAQLRSRAPASDPATELWQAAEAATAADAKDAARLTDAALRIPVAVQDTEGHQAATALWETPAPGQPVVRLRVPGSSCPRGC